MHLLLLVALAAIQTIYTLPQNVRWVPLTGKDVAPGGFRADIRGKENDACGQLLGRKFRDGYVFPMHVNGVYGIYMVIQGTLVLGFDKTHRRSGERVLPVGSIVQGLATEPHYGRAIGETIFYVYVPCSAKTR
jgi:hypothetical protein